ncbi:UNVERIFIED_CONTAM: hypothetical protein RMT77_013869 [Armadillidium vulgare]
MLIIYVCLITCSLFMKAKCCKDLSAPVAKSRFPFNSLNTFLGSGMDQNDADQYSPVDDNFSMEEGGNDSSSSIMGTSMFDVINSFLNAGNAKKNETSKTDFSPFAALLAPFKEKSGNNVTGVNSVKGNDIISSLLNSGTNKTNNGNFGQFAALLSSFQQNSGNNLTGLLNAMEGNDSDEIINDVASSLFNSGKSQEGSGKTINFKDV